MRAATLVSALGRIAIGTGLMVAPELSLRALGFSEVSPALKAVARVAGIRDLVLGGVTLSAMDDPERLLGATVANATADAGDTAAFALALRDGERDAGLRGLVPAALATAGGIWAAWRLS